MTASTAACRPGRMFCSIAAQADNLGDIAIRQVFLDFLDSTGVTLTVFTGSMPASYVGAFHIPAGSTLVASPADYARRLVWSVVSRRGTHVGFAPGPFELRAGVRSVKAAVLLALLGLVRLRSGRVVALGRAVRGGSRVARAIQRQTVRSTSLFVARDDVTAQVLGLPVRSAPDLGLLTRPAEPRPRTYVAISLRSDSEVSEELLRRVVAQARAAGLTPVFVTQVRRDDERHTRLAAALGTELCDWGHHTHAEQLARVEAVYARTDTVLSNRLHAIVFGVRRGAFPVAVSRGPDDKVVTTLSRWVPLTEQDPRSGEPAFRLSCDPARESERAVVLGAVEAAGRVLAEVRDDLVRTVSR